MAEERPATTPLSLVPGLLTARRLLEWRREALPRASEAVLLTHQTRLLRSLAPRFRTRALKGLSAEVRPVAGGQLAVAGKLGVGGPATAVLVEELAVAGVRAIVAVDIAASIDLGLYSGSLVLASTALCGDGTSRHYASGEKSVAADETLMRQLEEALATGGLRHARAGVWSTDAPYRETQALIEEARRRGAGLIDMETAALYASCAALGIAVVSLLVVADEIFDEWRPPADSRLIQAQLSRAAAIVVSLLRDESRSVR
jgi:uridine phosphorylase